MVGIVSFFATIVAQAIIAVAAVIYARNAPSRLSRALVVGAVGQPVCLFITWLAIAYGSLISGVPWQVAYLSTTAAGAAFALLFAASLFLELRSRLAASAKPAGAPVAHA